jgi:hypothetical protein
MVYPESQNTLEIHFIEVRNLVEEITGKISRAKDAHTIACKCYIEIDRSGHCCSSSFISPTRLGISGLEWLAINSPTRRKSVCRTRTCGDLSSPATGVSLATVATAQHTFP